MTSHTIVDFNMSSGFACKAGFITDVNKVETPPSVVYASVVSRDSVWIVLMLTSLNGLDVKRGGVQNAYLNAKTK